MRFIRAGDVSKGRRIPIEVMFMATHSISEDRFADDYQTGAAMCGQPDSTMLAQCLQLVSAICFPRCSGLNFGFVWGGGSSVEAFPDVNVRRGRFLRHIIINRTPYTHACRQTCTRFDTGKNEMHCHSASQVRDFITADGYQTQEGAEYDISDMCTKGR